MEVEMLLIIMQGFCLFFCDFKGSAASLASYDYQTKYIPLHKIDRIFNPLTCNNSHTHSPRNASMYIIDGVSGELCELPKLPDPEINMCGEKNFLETTCFETREVNLTVTVNCAVNKIKNTIQETVRIDVVNCSPIQMELVNCTSPRTIDSLRVEEMTSHLREYNREHFKYCGELVSNFTKTCSLSHRKDKSSFETSCLKGLDTRCLVRKYLYANFTCVPKKVVTVKPSTFVMDSTIQTGDSTSQRYTSSIYSTLPYSTLNEESNAYTAVIATSNSNGSIIGGAFGGVVFIAILTCIIVLIYRRLRSDSRRNGQTVFIKSHSYQNTVRDFECTGVQNVAKPIYTEFQSHETELGSGCYHEIRGSLMNTNGTCNDINSFAKLTESPDVQNSKTSIFAKPLSKDQHADNGTMNDNYFVLERETFNITEKIGGEGSKENNYGNRGNGTYDTANYNAHSENHETDEVNPYDIRVSGTYDTAQHLNRLTKANQADDVNHYDLRVSETYDTTQLSLNPCGQDMSDDINPYDFRVSGTYDTTQQVARICKKHDDDDSVNDYDHFYEESSD